MGVFSESRTNFLLRQRRQREIDPEFRALGSVDQLIAAEQIRAEEGRGTTRTLDEARTVFTRFDRDQSRRAVFDEEHAGSALTARERRSIFARQPERAFSSAFTQEERAAVEEQARGSSSLLGDVARGVTEIAPITTLATGALRPASEEEEGVRFGEAVAQQSRGALETVDRATGGPLLRGALIGLGEEDLSVQAAIQQAWANPNEFGGERLPLVRDIENPILRGGAGFGAEVFLDLTNVVGGAGVIRGTAQRIGQRGVREAAEATARRTSPDPAERLVQAVRDATPVRKATEAARSEELARRAQQISNAREETTGFDFLARARMEQRGELPRADIEPLQAKFTPDDIQALGERIRVSGLSSFDAPNAMEALENVLYHGKIPTPSEQKLLETVYGEELIEALRLHRSGGRKAFEAVVDAANIPRAILSSFDISAPFRQGALFVSRGEFWRGWVPMIKAFGSEDFAKRAADELASGPNAARRDSFGVYRASRQGTRITQREEAFLSSFAERIPILGPIIRASERAYTTFLNKLRADIFDNTVAKWERNGVATPDDMHDLARMVNWATGRGSLPNSDIVAASNSVFFSPRLWVSRLQYPTLAASKSRKVRSEVARDLAGFIGAGTGMLTLLQASGLADEVELDPRASDFARIRIGDTRIDPWAGFQPIARTIAQIISGELKPSGTPPTGAGDILGGGLGTPEVRSVDRFDTALRHGRSKLAPAAALVVDLVTGETFLGDEFDATNPEDFAQAGVSRFVPLSIQDITEAVQQEGLLGGVKGVPGFVGFGVNSYTVPRDTLNSVASGLYAQDRVSSPFYSHLDQGERRLVREDERWKLIEEELEQEEDLDSEAALAYASQRLDDHYEDLESELRNHLDAGIQGGDRKRVIQEFLEGRFQASEALFTEELFANRDPLSVRDAFAEQYWSVDAPVDYATGDVDYSTLDARRAEVLAVAQAEGVDAEYITGSGPGSWRGIRFEDPVVREAVEEYQGITEGLDQTGYFDLKEQAWAFWTDSLNLSLQEATYRDWVRAERNSIANVLVEDHGWEAGPAFERATREVAAHTIPRRFNEFYRNGYRHQWVVENPELASRAVEFDLFTPDTQELDFLSTR